MHTLPLMPTTLSQTTSSPHDAQTARINEGVTKEVRAHEHARHRIKERREHALAKERKEKKAAGGRTSGFKAPHANGAKLVRRLSMESWDGETPESERTVREAASAQQGVVPEVTLQVPESEPPESEHDVAHMPRDSTGPFTHLTLGDLISRPRRPKAKQLDFEVIPPIRAVIALDDAEADEPWEYITRASLNDGSAWKGKSYAQVAASAM